MTTKLCKKLQYHFETKFSLKERKRKTTKEKFPLKPLLKEKKRNIKETASVCLRREGGFSSRVSEIWRAV